MGIRAASSARTFRSGRIVAVADVYHALTHDRPYKRAWPVAKARAELRTLAGRQFDPAVVEAFERLERHAVSFTVAV